MRKQAIEEAESKLCVPKKQAVEKALVGEHAPRKVYTPFHHIASTKLAGIREEASANRGAVELQISQQRGAGLGLFAIRLFRAGDIICRFQGSLRADRDYFENGRGSRPAKSHVLSLRSGGHVLDGAPIAEALSSGSQDVVLDEGVGVQRRWRLRDLGLGCMVNHGPANAHFILVHCDRERILPAEAYVQATAEIPAGKEIFVRYGNAESMAWK